MKIEFRKLITAYRKAKVDLYYSTNPSLFAIADYEDNLEQNLKKLHTQINSNDSDWVDDISFLGGWSLIPKSYSVETALGEDAECKCDKASPAGIVFASSARSQNKYNPCEDNLTTSTATFRLMAECSLDFHVLSALWIMEVGAFFDAKLADSVRGSRLRRQDAGDKSFNEGALGSFKPYLQPFKAWRDDGINAMRAGLSANKNLLALTADATSYYHRLDPDFMLTPSFHAAIGLELNTSQHLLNSLFVRALKAWAKKTPLQKGLPVGLPASAIIANMALYELDLIIERELRPIYYGRYIDDIMLVLENKTEICSQADIWELIANTSGTQITLSSDKTKVSFSTSYLANSTIEFENSKNRAFVLDGFEGKTLIDAIAEQIYLRASEWRALPNLPLTPLEVATDLMKATNVNGNPILTHLPHKSVI